MDIDKIPSLSDVVSQSSEQVRLLKDIIDIKKLKVPRYSTGLEDFDDIMNGGFKMGDLVIISGKPGSGKTTMSQTLTYNLCKAKHQVLWFTYEVSPEHLHQKFIEMGIQDFYTVYAPQKNITGHLSWVKKKIKEGWEKYETKFIFIDHIDFLTPANNKTTDNEAISYKKIATELKTLAIELDVVIVLMAHLKKTDTMKEPELEDIGYCLPAGSLVLNADTGEEIDIEQIYKKKKYFNVVSFNQKLEQEIKPITDVYDNNIKDVYKIKTSSGLKIEATEKHRFFNGFDWIQLKDLDVGDYISTPGHLPSYNNCDYNINLVEIIGWMLGDGQFTKYGTGSLVLQDKEDLNHIIKLLKNTNVNYRFYDHKKWFVLKLQTRKNKKDKFINDYKSNDLKELIIDLGLIDKKHANKKIPGKLLNQNNNVISVLLRGLFQSDGCVSNIDLKRKRLVVSFSNISIDMIQQMKMLLLRFGIRSRINKSKKNKFVLYKLTIEGKESIIKFNNSIKLINKKGKNIKKMVSYIEGLSGVTKEIHNFLPPKYKELFLELKRDYKITWKKLGFRIHNYRKSIRKEHWNKINQIIGNDNFIPNNIDFDKIVEKVYVGQKQVYDLRIKDNHNFVCNEIYTHNSAGMGQLADYVFMVWREMKHLSGRGINKYTEEPDGELMTNRSVIKIVKNRETGRLKYLLCEYINGKYVKYRNEIDVEEFGKLLGKAE